VAFQLLPILHHAPYPRFQRRAQQFTGPPPGSSAIPNDGASIAIRAALSAAAPFALELEIGSSTRFLYGNRRKIALN
jgi:hypothetical protein